MCSWCDKASLGKVMVSANKLPLICEHCGSDINKDLTHKNIVEWAREIVKRDEERKNGY